MDGEVERFLGVDSVKLFEVVLRGRIIYDKDWGVNWVSELGE